MIETRRGNRRSENWILATDRSVSRARFSQFERGFGAKKNHRSREWTRDRQEFLNDNTFGENEEFEKMQQGIFYALEE